MIPVMVMRTRMEHVIQLKNVFKKVAQMKEAAHKDTVYVAHVSLVKSRDANFPAIFIPWGFGESGNGNLSFLGDRGN